MTKKRLIPPRTTDEKIDHTIRLQEELQTAVDMIADLLAERARMQEQIDRAYSALSNSQYVGGPTEREAWQTAAEALGPLATQHTADNPDAHKGRKS